MTVSDWHQYSFFVEAAKLTSIRTVRQELLNMVNGVGFLLPQVMTTMDEASLFEKKKNIYG